METLISCKLCGATRLECVDHETQISKCLNCGYIFDNPRPSFEEIAEYYSQTDNYIHWLRDIKARGRLWNRRRKIVNRWKTPGALLDIGTGIGQFLHVVKDDFDSVDGTEVSTQAIRIAITMYRLDIRQGQIEQLEFDRKFDTITLFHVLEHVGDPGKTIDRCRELLNDNGTLIIAVPNDIESLKARAKKRPWGLPRIALDGSVPEIHLSHFTVAVLERLLADRGFLVTYVGLDPYFIDTGARKIYQELYYIANRGIWALFRTNLYDTTLIIAKKPGE